MNGGSTILVTGGAGFIGSHTCLVLLDRGYEVVVADNYSNSSPGALDRVQKLAGRPLRAYDVDLHDRRDERGGAGDERLLRPLSFSQREGPLDKLELQRVGE